jgi:hypothetical protein
LLTSNAQDFAPLVVEWFLAEREHWGVIIVPGQTDKSLLSHALKNIVQQYTADSFKNTIVLFKNLSDLYTADLAVIFAGSYGGGRRDWVSRCLVVRS